MPKDQGYLLFFIQIFFLFLCFDECFSQQDVSVCDLILTFDKIIARSVRKSQV